MSVSSIYICLINICATKSENVPLDIMRPMKIQISLCSCMVWSESSLGEFWIAKDTKFLYVDNKDWSDCEDEQSDLSLRYVHMSEGRLSKIATHNYVNWYNNFKWFSLWQKYIWASARQNLQ